MPQPQTRSKTAKEKENATNAAAADRPASEAKKPASKAAGNKKTKPKPLGGKKNPANTGTSTTASVQKKSAGKKSTKTSNRAGREDPQAAADPSLAITLEDLETLDAEDLKRKGRAIYVHLGFTNIHDQLTDEHVEDLRNYFVDFKGEHFRALMKRILPGYDEKSSTFKTLLSHLQRALFPPADIDGLPKHSNGKYCDVSLAALYVGVCGLHPNPRWKQDTLRRGIELQLESVDRGDNHHCSDLSDKELKIKLINEHKYVPSRVNNIKSRLNLLQKLWGSQGFQDYTSQEVPRHAPNADGGGADATHSNRVAAFGGDAAGGGGADAAAGAAGGGGAMPSSGSNVIHPETPNPQQSSVGNGGGNDLNTQILQMIASQGEQIALGFHQHREDQKKRDKERDEEQKQRDKERAEQCKTNDEQAKMNESLVEKNEEQDGERKELLRQMIVTKNQISTLQTDVGKMRTDVDVLQNGQTEQQQGMQDLWKEQCKSAKKADRNNKLLKKVIAASGWEMDLSSPESTATNDGEVDSDDDVKPTETTPSNLKDYANDSGSLVVRGDIFDSPLSSEGMTEAEEDRSLSPKTLRLGANHSVAAVSGSGTFGQLGLGPDCLESRMVKEVANLREQDVFQITAGGMHTLLLSENGKVYSWGCNDDASLGVLEPNEEGFSPTQVTGFYPSQHGPNGTDGLQDDSGNILPFLQRPEACIVQVHAGKSTQSLALCSNGNVFSFGAVKDGDNRNFCFEPPKDDPRPTISPKDMAKVESGDEDIVKFTVPRGTNNHPVHLTKMPQRATAISAGEHFNAAILEDNTLVTWGLGIKGEMARPVCEVTKTTSLDLITEERLTPHPVQWAGPSLKRTVLQVSCGSFHLLAVSREGNNQLSVYSSGLNQDGQLGLGDKEDRNTLTKAEFFEGKDIESVAGANFTSYFVGGANKKLYSVGRGDYGDLGVTLKQPEVGFSVSTPLRVPLEYDVQIQGNISEPTQNCIVEATINEYEQPEIEQVAAGDRHVIVITKQRDVYSWGFGENGQCGQNKRDSSDQDDDITLPQKMIFTEKKATHRVICASGGAQHSAFAFVINPRSQLSRNANSEEESDDESEAEVADSSDTAKDSTGGATEGWGWGGMFKKSEEGSWKCGVCMVTNSPSALKCPACETVKPGSEGKAADTTSSAAAPAAGGIGAGGFSFGSAAAPAPATSATTTTTTGFNFAARKKDDTTTPASGGFTFGVPSSTTASAPSGFNFAAPTPAPAKSSPPNTKSVPANFPL